MWSLACWIGLAKGPEGWVVETESFMVERLVDGLPAAYAWFALNLIVWPLVAGLCLFGRDIKSRMCLAVEVEAVFWADEGANFSLIASLAWDRFEHSELH